MTTRSAIASSVSRRTTTRRPWGAVGAARTVSLPELMPLLDNATDLLGLAPHKARRLIDRVRRFPAPGDVGHERIRTADEKPLSHVDRIEAIDAVYELFSVPRARSLVSDARRLLGHVLRDVTSLQDLLDELADRMGFPRGPKEAHRKSSGPTRRVVETSLRRVRAGYLISVVK